MKGILLLLCLIGTTLAAITKLNTGLYSYTSDLVVSGSPVSISASAVVSFVERDEAAQSTTFALRVGGVLVITGEDKIYKDDQVYALPFQFVRTDAGQIVSVKVHPNEFLEAANLKKSIAESFQTSTLEHNDHVVTETGANGVRNAHYKVIHSDSQSIGIRGTYSERDFVSFPSLSGMENGGFSISSKKVSTINPRDNNFKMAMITTEIAKAEEMTTLLKTRIEFTSSEVAMIDMIDEADWKVESLMHEIDPLNRKNVLKTTLPSVETLMAQISNDPSSTKEILKARSQLVTLANNCKKSAKKIVAQLGEMLQSETANSARIYNILARINSEEAQLLLSNEIASAAKDAKKLRSIFNALVALNNPSAPEILTMTLLNLEVPKESKELYELTVGNVAKFLHPAEAEYVLAPFVKELETAEGSRKIQLLHTLGNAGANAPADLIVSYLSDAQIPVRGAALANLRNFLHLEKVQQQVMNALKQKENIESKPFVSSLLTSLKESTKKNSLSSNFAEFLNQLAIGAQLEDLSQFLKEKNMFAHQSLQTPIDVKSSTNIWNDTSDPNYNLVSPAAQRQRDVDTYPIYTAQLMARQLGPRPTNLKAAAGVFSGSDGSCLADNFKIFDKLLIETNILGEKTILADVQLYVYTFDNAFESRIYAVINGNTLIDFELTADNCTAEEFIIFDGELEIFNNQTEIPIDMGTVLIYGSALAHLEFDAGYIVCLTSSYLELYIVGKTDIIVDVGVTITALGVVRVGVEFDVYADYILGPDTHIGSPSNATIPKFTGQLAQKQAKLTKEIRTCETCIGIYYGHSDQIAYLGLFIQRREGLGWGDPVKIPIIESVTPGVPFPEPIIETCDNWEFPTLAPMA